MISEATRLRIAPMSSLYHSRVVPGTSHFPAHSWFQGRDTLCSQGCFAGCEGCVLTCHSASQGMYLDPLAEIVAANGGLVYNASRYARLCDAVTLMVDVKQVRRKRELNPPTVVACS